MSRIINAAVLLASLLFPAPLRPAMEKTYFNPVLVDTYSIKRLKPAPYTGTLGIGDPAVIFHGGKYYLYPTGDNHSYYVYISHDLVHWEKGPKIFETKENGLWAPDVFFDPEDEMFYLYYTVDGRIGVATSDRPDGAFHDLGSLIRSAIDAHMFRDDDGRCYLYYARYPEFGIFVQPMAGPAGKKGGPVRLISPDEGWEQRDVPITEAPWILKHKGIYYLLYSGGSANTEYYATGYATSRSPLGPFTKYLGNPIVREGRGILGPGHLSVTTDSAGKLWMVYHQQKNTTRGWNRVICIDPLWFDEKGVLHARASRATPEPAPVTAGGSVEATRR